MDTILIKRIKEQSQANSQPSIIGSLSDERQNEIREHTKKANEAFHKWYQQRGNAMELARNIISDVRGRPAVIYYGLEWNELDYVPRQGKCIFTYGSWVSKVIEGPTALDIAFLADDAIVATADYAFRWVEAIKHVGAIPTDINIYELIMNT
jgi:hypothetical protein